MLFITDKETKLSLSDEVTVSLPAMSLLERLSLLCHSSTQSMHFVTLVFFSNEIFYNKKYIIAAEKIPSTDRDMETGTNLLDYHYLTFLCYTVLLGKFVYL